MSAIRRFFSVDYKYLTPLARQRAGALLVMNALLFVSWAVYVIYFVIPGLIRGLLPEPAVIGALFVVPILTVTIYRFIQTGRLNGAIWLFIFLLCVAEVPLIDFSISFSLPVFLLIPLAAAGVLLERRNFLVILVILMLVMLARAAVLSQVTQANLFSQFDTPEFKLLFVTILLVSLLLYTFSGSTQRIAHISAEDIAHLKTVISLAPSEDENLLMAKLLRSIQNDLSYSLAQIFLMSDDGTPQRRIRLGIGENELTASSIINDGDVMVARDVFTARQSVIVNTKEQQPRRSHLIVSAQNALAVPIMNENQVIGVLDVQTAFRQPFSPNQVEAFSLFGQRLGEALYRARLLTDLRRSLREQEEAALSMRNQFAEMQRRDRQTVVSGWNNYLQSRGQLFGYDLQGQSGNLVPSADLPIEIRTALERGDVFIESRDNEQIINAPIVFRGEVLGAMSFVVPSERPVAERELDMVRTVANRLGVALENNRLLEQTQAQAHRERKASEVANVLLTATNIETLMELAADNFNEALDAIYTRIYLEPGIVVAPPAARGEPA